jgi:hypothetical protein
MLQTEQKGRKPPSVAELGVLPITVCLAMSDPVLVLKEWSEVSCESAL